MFRYGSLFSGAGLLDYGVHETCPSLSCEFAVELDDNRRKMFGAHFPGAMLLRDVQLLPCAELPAIDGLIGGIPCNLFSTANTNKDNSRDIFDGPAAAAFAIVERLRPRWTVWESSAKDRTWARWVPVVRRELYSLGHASMPLRMRSAPRGSSHDRERAFVFSWRPPADPDRDREPPRAINEEVARIRATPVDLWDGRLSPELDRRVFDGCDIELARAIGYGVDQRVARDVGRVLSALLGALG